LSYKTQNAQRKTRKMNRYDLIKYFIDKIESYEQAQTDAHNLSVEGFNDWMFKQFLDRKESEKTNVINEHYKANEVNVNLSVLVGTLFRYVKNYSKKIFENSTIQNIDEFTYLAILINNGKMTKSDLISRNVHEKTTGMEIIRRLIGYGFVTQSDDPHDKRSQLVEITAAGQVEIFKLFEEMSQVSTLVSGDLTEQEKMILSYLLEKLDIFHRHIYDHEKNEDLGILIEKYFAK
jgi:MarR family transcriptional regulator, lower aerobic nicotinate degradation pathway regulator